MLSLYKTTSEIRLVIKWLSIIAGMILGVYFLIQFGGFVKEIISPTPPPPPTVTFGKLPEIPFQASLDGSKYSYVLNTVSGNLPTFPDRAKVYKFSFAPPNLLAIERARERVRKIGFLDQGTALSATMYQWNEAVTPYRRLTADVLNFNFDMTSQYFNDEAIKSGENLPNENDSKKVVTDFLESLSSLPDDIDEEKTKTTLYEISNSDLIQSTSFSNTQIIRIDLFQKDLDEMKIYYPTPLYSTMNFLVAGGRAGGQIVQTHYVHNNLTENSATYPIITANQAWELLKKGNAHIALNEGTSNTISIKEVTLAYYSPNKKHDYLMPIVVFEGEDNFFAYVSAIQESWINKEE
jgi:hypothetical protein